MARTTESSKTLMDKNISYGLKIIAEGVEAQKNGEEIIDSKIDLNEIAEDLLYLSRHSDVPFEILAQKNTDLSDLFKKLFFHGTKAMMKVEECLKEQPAEAAEETFFESIQNLFEEEKKTTE